MLVTSLTYVAGWVLGDVALRRHLGSLQSGRALWPVLRMVGVSVIAGLLGRLVLIVTEDLFGTSVAGSLGTLLVGTVVIGVATLAGLAIARVPELHEPLAAVRARLGRG
jgi:putative peptidoglycan lipid II flippase